MLEAELNARVRSKFSARKMAFDKELAQSRKSRVPGVGWPATLSFFILQRQFRGPGVPLLPAGVRMARILFQIIRRKATH